MTGSTLSRRVYRRRITWVGLGIVGIRMRVDGHGFTDSRGVTESSGHNPHISKDRKSPKRAKEVGILSEIPSQARNIFGRSTFFAVLNNVRVDEESINRKVCNGTYSPLSVTTTDWEVRRTGNAAERQTTVRCSPKCEATPMRWTGRNLG
jgi:hypothetical protein